MYATKLTILTVLLALLFYKLGFPPILSRTCSFITLSIRLISQKFLNYHIWNASSLLFSCCPPLTCTKFCTIHANDFNTFTPIPKSTFTSSESQRCSDNDILFASPSCAGNENLSCSTLTSIYRYISLLCLSIFNPNSIRIWCGNHHNTIRDNDISQVASVSVTVTHLAGTYGWGSGILDIVPVG